MGGGNAPPPSKVGGQLPPLPPPPPPSPTPLSLVRVPGKRKRERWRGREDSYTGQTGQSEPGEGVEEIVRGGEGEWG